MVDKKSKKSFLAPGLGGGFAGLLLWAALNKIVEESITWWMGFVLMAVCIFIGVVFQAIDERKKETDVVINKNKKQNSTVSNNKDYKEESE